MLNSDVNRQLFRNIFESHPRAIHTNCLLRIGLRNPMRPFECPDMACSEVFTINGVRLTALTISLMHDFTILLVPFATAKLIERRPIISASSPVAIYHTVGVHKMARVNGTMSVYYATMEFKWNLHTTILLIRFGCLNLTLLNEGTLRIFNVEPLETAITRSFLLAEVYEHRNLLLKPLLRRRQQPQALLGLQWSPVDCSKSGVYVLTNPRKPYPQAYHESSSTSSTAW